MGGGAGCVQEVGLEKSIIGNKEIEKCKQIRKRREGRIEKKRKEDMWLETNLTHREKLELLVHKRGQQQQKDTRREEDFNLKDAEVIQP